MFTESDVRRDYTNGELIIISLKKKINYILIRFNLEFDQHNYFKLNLQFNYNLELNLHGIVSIITCIYFLFILLP